MKTTFFIVMLVALNLNPAFSSESQNQPEKPVLKATGPNYELLLSRVSNNQIVLRLIKVDDDIFNIRVFDSEGNRLYYKKIKKNNKTKTIFDISEFPAGAYTFKIIRNKKELYSEKIEKD